MGQKRKEKKKEHTANKKGGRAKDGKAFLSVFKTGVLLNIFMYTVIQFYKDSQINRKFKRFI